MRRILTNTTALVACLSLSLPAPVGGQEGQAEEAELCADGAVPPCEDAAEAPASEGEAAEGEAAAGEPDGEAGVIEGEVADAPAPDEAVAAEEPVEPEADVAVEAEPEAGDEPAAEAEGAEPEQTVEPEPEADVAVETEPEAEEPAADAVEPAGEGAAAAEAEADRARSEAAAEAVRDGAAAAEERAAPKAAAAEAEAAKRQRREAAQAERERRAERREQRKSAEEKAAVEKAAAEDAAKAAANTAAAKAGADAKGRVTEETVTEESSRSSDENFASRLTEVFDGSGDDDNRDVLVGTVLGALGGFAASQLLAGREVVASSADRVVVQGPDGEYQILKDDDALLRQPGANVRTETFDDGSTRTTVTREDGSRVVTIRDAGMRVLRRTRITPDGREIVLIDDTGATDAIDVTALPLSAEDDAGATADEDELRRALEAVQQPGRRYSLAQVREIRAVRALAPAIRLDNVTFETGSAAIRPDQAEELNELGRLLAGLIEENPREVFLVEGHTDAVGDAAFNLALSDRRAESVALALTEYFDVPPENLVVQGYGERYLRVDTEGPERQNRRAGVRRITDLLQVASAD